MPLTNPSTIVSFDGDAAVDAIRERVDGTVFSVVEYDLSDYRALFVDDATMAFYEDEAEMDAHFGLIHSHVNLDFAEIDLVVDELFPIANEVVSIATRLDYLQVVRVYGDHEGIFVAMEPDEPTDPAIDAIRAVIEG